MQRDATIVGGGIKTPRDGINLGVAVTAA